MTAPPSLAERLRRAYARFLDGEPSALVDLLADDVVYRLPGRHLGGGTLRGKAALLERLAAAARWCPTPPAGVLLDVAGAGALVVSVEHLTAERPGGRLSQHAAVVWRFAADGRCVEIATWFEDQAAVDRFWEPFVPADDAARALHECFTAYARAFDAHDVDAIARYYRLPCVFARAGSIAVVESAEALHASLGELVAAHERAGFGRARVGALSVLDRTADGAIVTVEWTVETVTGAPLWRFAVTYDVVRSGDAWHILAATTHATGAT
jgi:ketosteroid isomerase-like protein